MSDPESFAEMPADFDGRVRLFPLPELVVFPNAMQPLHIFEPRYCEMLEEALATDQLIAMATLSPGWQQPVCGQPAIESHVCICRVVSHTPTEDDRHNILLIGVRRARIVEEEFETGRPFRSARVELLDDIYPASHSEHRARLKRDLLAAFRDLFPDVASVQKNLHDLMASQMRLGPVTDIIGFTIQFDSANKIALLGEGNVDRRAEMLIEILRARAAESLAACSQPTPQLSTSFPPPFSLN